VKEFIFICPTKFKQIFVEVSIKIEEVKCSDEQQSDSAVDAFLGNVI